MVFRKRRRESENAFALYYASDVHGSDQCWRKFLGAGRFYEVNALLMGGDLTGKAVVPIELQPDGSFSAEFLGETAPRHRPGDSSTSSPRRSATTACTPGSRAQRRSRDTAPMALPAASCSSR